MDNPALYYIDLIEKTFQKLNEYNSLNILIEGEKGSGKNYILDDFFAGKTKKMEIFPIHCGSNDSTAFSAIKHITLPLSAKQNAPKTAILSVLMTAFINLISSLPPSVTLVNLPEIDPNDIQKLINNIEKQVKDKVICVYVSNIQWIDKESFNILKYLMSAPKSKQWLFVSTYANNAEITQSNHFTHLELRRVLSDSRCFEIPNVSISINRWKEEELPLLCSSILLGEVNLTKAQYKILHKKTDGLPYYVKSVLERLKSECKIINKNQIWTSPYKWNSNEIKELLTKEFKSFRLDSAYSHFPGCKEILEVASVIGNKFDSILINKSLEHDKSNLFLNLLYEHYKLVELLRSDEWQFDHIITREYIYELLGHSKKQIHLKIASILENSTEDYNIISEHYRLGGNITKSVSTKIKYISSLFDQGLYVSASNQLETIIEDDDYYFIEEEDKVLHQILKSIPSYHKEEYDICKNNLLTIHDNNISPLTKAILLKWLGKVYMKFSSPDLFVKSLDCLQRSVDIFTAHDKYLEAALIEMDLIIAYARINDFINAEKYFIKAEKHLSKTNDVVSRSRLLRKSVAIQSLMINPDMIEIAARKHFNELPHELIMSLNNVATLYIFKKNYSKAEKLLKECLRLSKTYFSFGESYTHNNLGVIYYFQDNEDKAKKHFQLVKKKVTREVDKLLIDINLYAIYDSLKKKNVQNELRKIYNLAVDVSEDEYTLPSALNLSRSLIDSGKYNEAFMLLKENEVRINTHTAYYKSKLWYNMMLECCNTLSKHSEKEQLINKYSSKISPINQQQPHVYSGYALLTLQFWSN